MACTNGVTVISGNAGTGKSTILGIITKIFKRLEYEIDQVALSEKAALRIEETTKMEAKTIHRWYKGISLKKIDASEEIEELPEVKTKDDNEGNVEIFKSDISNPYLAQ
ncbi:AAA family ATPase [Bacillus cereus]|uniref:AAA family ATPase n=1 Tax=Bacillus cereus TaxID=1396 RepID=UPI00019FDC8A|nr:AAA family ATPase [Bacillus cereus]EEK59002.1 hypothetical protein bcere0005_53840 [Bacillus cereus 172560W]WPA85884.1 AAA family ATPase [Bacillus cereus]